MRRDLRDVFPNVSEVCWGCLAYALCGLLAWMVIWPQHFVATLLKVAG